MASKSKKISNAKWTILFIVTGIVDLVQLIITFTGVGIVASEVAEPYIGAGLIILMQGVMKINLITKPRRMASLLAGLGLDALTGGAAPFWVLDVWYIRYDVKKEEAATEMQESQQDMSNTPLYVDGKRMPTNARTGNSKPLVSNGVRAPSNGGSTGGGGK